MTQDHDQVTLLGRAGWRWTTAPASPPLITADGLSWACAPRTDFWRITEGLESKHDGQALLLPQGGNFGLEATFEAALDAQYDQIGFLVEADEERWLKLGIELDGRPWLSAVHTDGASDWSREPHEGLPVTLRVERQDGTITSSVKHDGNWRAFRIVHLIGSLRVGVYSCAPQGPGFTGRVYNAHWDDALR